MQIVGECFNRHLGIFSVRIITLLTGWVDMIVYKDILQKLKDAGYNTNRIRRERLISESILQRIRRGAPITTETIDILCRLIGCSISDLIEFVPDVPDSTDRLEQ